METQIRPFTNIVGPFGVDTNTSSITLRDSAGNALKCNYIRVEASGSDTDNALSVSYDPTGITNQLRNSGGLQEMWKDSASDAYAASGFVGSVTQAVGGFPVEFLLADPDRVDTIYIQPLNTNGSIYAIITYGQIQAGNIRRDNERPIGS